VSPYLPDNNWLVGALEYEFKHNRVGPARRLLQSKRKIFLNTVSYAEFLSGPPSEIRTEIVRRLGFLPMISYPEAQHAASLRRRRAKHGKPLSLPDALMAASALRHRCQLLTADRDYSGIPGLKWSHYPSSQETPKP